MKVAIILLAIAIAFVLFLRYLARYSKEPGEGTHVRYYFPDKKKEKYQDIAKK